MYSLCLLIKVFSNHIKVQFKKENFMGNPVTLLITNICRRSHWILDEVFLTFRIVKSKGGNPVIHRIDRINFIV